MKVVRVLESQHSEFTALAKSLCVNQPFLFGKLLDAYREREERISKKARAM